MMKEEKVSFARDKSHD